MNRSDHARPVLAQLVRNRRRELGLTQAELAGTFHISQPQVSAWEAKGNIAGRHLVHLAEWLDVSLEELVRLRFLGAVGDQRDTSDSRTISPRDNLEDPVLDMESSSATTPTAWRWVESFRSAVRR